MSKRKSDEQIADQEAGSSTTTKSTLIEDLNKLSQESFQSRFFPSSSSISTSHTHNNNTTWTSKLYFAKDLHAALLHQCFTLIETTSRHDYEPSSFGWHPRRKKREMQEPEMRYLLLNEKAFSNPHDAGNKFGGFLSFMFTHDSNPSVPVLYIYEIHLTESARGKGVGGWLMELIENVAREAAVEKIMLTCFLSNANALAFYRKLGFERDACSPGDRETRRKVVKADYVIMSKRLGECGEEWESGSGSGDEVEEEVTNAIPEGGPPFISANVEREGNGVGPTRKKFRSLARSTGPSSSKQVFPQTQGQKVFGRRGPVARRSNVFGTAPPTSQIQPATPSTTALEISQSRTSDLSAQLKRWQEDYQRATKTLRETGNLNNTLKARIAKTDETRRKYQVEGRTLRETQTVNLMDGIASMTKATANAVAMRKALLDLQEEVDYVESENVELQDRVDEIETEKDELETERDSLRIELHATEEARVEMEAERDEWRLLCARRGVMLEELREEIDVLREEVENAAPVRNITQIFNYR